MKARLSEMCFNFILPPSAFILSLQPLAAVDGLCLPCEEDFAVVERLAEGSAADFILRIFNPDGGEAAMSGNGSRCAAACLHFEKLWTADELRFMTRAGVKRYTLREQLGGGAFRFEAEIGRPVFDSASIPMLTLEPLAEVRDYTLALADGETVTVTALQMCNPNCCAFVEDFERTDWRRLGRTIESHAAFPERTNVEFVRTLDRQNIEARVWERGAGETLSSGTGACAAAVASMIGGRTDRRVRAGGFRFRGGLVLNLLRGYCEGFCDRRLRVKEQRSGEKRDRSRTPPQ